MCAWYVLIHLRNQVNGSGALRTWTDMQYFGTELIDLENLIFNGFVSINPKEHYLCAGLVQRSGYKLRKICHAVMIEIVSAAESVVLCVGQKVAQNIGVVNTYTKHNAVAKYGGAWTPGIVTVMSKALCIDWVLYLTSLIFAPACDGVSTL